MSRPELHALEAGDIVGLVGANGAGKTTLLHLAVGLAAPSAGRATCHEAPGASVRAVDRCIRAQGFLKVDVFQPASRFWLFQGIEFALFVGLAVGLLAFMVWWVRGRIS